MVNLLTPETFYDVVLFPKKIENTLREKGLESRFLRSHMPVTSFDEQDVQTHLSNAGNCPIDQAIVEYCLDRTFAALAERTMATIKSKFKGTIGDRFYEGDPDGSTHVFYEGKPHDEIRLPRLTEIKQDSHVQYVLWLTTSGNRVYNIEKRQDAARAIVAQEQNKKREAGENVTDTIDLYTALVMPHDRIKKAFKVPKGNTKSYAEKFLEGHPHNLILALSATKEQLLNYGNRCAP